MQIWNVNRTSGVVGVFHLQGSSWDRNRRQFVIHDKAPPPLETAVRVVDVEPLRAAAAASAAAQGNGAAGAASWAAYHSGTGRLHQLNLDDALPVKLDSEFWFSNSRSDISRS